MKNFFAISALLGFMLLAFQTDSFAQENKMPGLDKSPLDAAYYPARAPFRAFEKDDEKKAALAPVMRILYSRPQLNGRSLEELIPKGEVYRLGANESAELLVISEVSIGGQTIEPGRYTIYTFSEQEGEASLIISSQLDGWGAYAYNEDADVARIDGTVSDADDSVEALTIMFTDDALVIAWANSRIEFSVE